MTSRTNGAMEMRIDNKTSTVESVIATRLCPLLKKSSQCTSYFMVEYRPYGVHEQTVRYSHGLPYMNRYAGALLCDTRANCNMSCYNSFW